MSDSLKKIPVKVVNSKQDEVVEISLFEQAKKIYPRQAKGLFNNWRIALVVITQLVFYGGPWLQWNDRQASLFDVLNRKFISSARACGRWNLSCLPTCGCRAHLSCWCGLT